MQERENEASRSMKKWKMCRGSVQINDSNSDLLHLPVEERLNFYEEKRKSNLIALAEDEQLKNKTSKLKTNKSRMKLNQEKFMQKFQNKETNIQKNQKLNNYNQNSIKEVKPRYNIVSNTQKDSQHKVNENNNKIH